MSKCSYYLSFVKCPSSFDEGSFSNRMRFLFLILDFEPSNLAYKSVSQKVFFSNKRKFFSFNYKYCLDFYVTHSYALLTLLILCFQSFHFEFALYPAS